MRPRACVYEKKVVSLRREIRKFYREQWLELIFYRK